jgi:predicted nucleic acid-binding protein
LAILIDSSVFIELERRRLRFRDFADRLEPSEPLAASAVTMSELLVGAHLADTDLRRAQREHELAEFFRAVEVFPFGILEAQTYARLWAHFRRTGATIPPHDLMIGSTALANEYDIMTDNRRHFERIPDLVVRRPQWPAARP